MQIEDSIIYRICNRIFKLDDHNTNIRTEILAGTTTFITMCYVIFVIPSILANTGMDKSAIFTATCLVSGVSSILMGLYANWPVGLAPGMGLNSFFAFSVVQGMGYEWQQAMGAVFWGGIGFMILSLFKIREWIIESIPEGLKIGITSGIGLFLALIGLKTAGIVVSNPSTLVSLGEMNTFEPIMASLSLFLIIALAFRGYHSCVLVSIIVVSMIAMAFGKVNYTGFFSFPPSLEPIVGKLNLKDALSPDMIGVIVAFIFINLFDTTGTLIAVGRKAKLVDSKGNIKNIKPAMVTDGITSWIGAFLGTPTVTSYVESASGVAAGGRTGLTAVTVGVLFLLSVFLSPLAYMIPSYATAGALVYVAVLMVNDLTRVKWNDLTEATPVLITFIMVPLSFSIANGIALGFISYPIIKLLAGKWREINVGIWILSILFILKFTFFGI